MKQSLRLLTLALATTLSLASTEAFAQKKPVTKGTNTDLGIMDIVGRVQKPLAAVDITRLAPKLTLSELRQPFLDRIEAAVYEGPF